MTTLALLGTSGQRATTGRTRLDSRARGRRGDLRARGTARRRIGATRNTPPRSTITTTDRRSRSPLKPVTARIAPPRTQPTRRRPRGRRPRRSSRISNRSRAPARRGYRAPTDRSFRRRRRPRAHGLDDGGLAFARSALAIRPAELSRRGGRPRARRRVPADDVQSGSDRRDAPIATSRRGVLRENCQPGVSFSREFGHQCCVAAPPVDRRDDFRPAGQPECLVGPFDVLCAPRRDDVDPTARHRRQTRPRLPTAHAPVPDDSVGPTPRSQMRMRTRSGASTLASSTFVPSGKNGCTARRGRYPRGAALSVAGPSTTHCGLPTRMTTASTRSPATSMISLRSSARRPHRPRETCSARPATRAARDAWARPPCPRRTSRRGRSMRRSRDPRGRAPHAVARTSARRHRR